MSVENKFKDSRPLETIARIRKTLENLDIITEESWMHDVEGYFSVHVKIFGTGLFSNGKGTTEEFAKASGYAELLERLQNFFMSGMLPFDASPGALRYRGFTFSPDEIHKDIEKSVKEDSWVHLFFPKDCSKVKTVSQIREWLMESGSGYDGLTLVPYLKINDGTICYMPETIVKTYFGSNGMCAGNTPEEALVQGLSEIIERYVNARIVNEGLTPPDIPREYIKNYPRLDKMIYEIEKHGRYKIVVKDCSLGEKLPVTGIIFIDMDLQRYFVKMGGHPVFEIALERCLTELLQGNSIYERKWTCDYSYRNNKINPAYNLVNIFISGKGYYPSTFFSDCYSYGFSEPADNRFSTNTEILSYLIKLFKARNLDIFVRDVSFLGFPSFYIVIPSFSEIITSPENAFDLLKSSYRISRITRKLQDASDDELEMLIRHMYAGNFNSRTSITGFMGIPFREEFEWTYILRDMLIFFTHYRKLEFGKAYEVMDRLIRSGVYGNDKLISYLKCVRDYTGFRSDGQTDENNILPVLNLFYPKRMVEQVLNDMRNPYDVFRNCSGVECYQCEKCAYSAHCNYPEIMQLHMKLKDKYAENPIDQGMNNFLTGIYQNL